VAHRFQLVSPDFSDRLRLATADSVESIMHVPTGILLHHAFPRNSDNTIIADWRNFIPAVAEKYTFLGNRTHEWIIGSTCPLLFIYGTGEHSVMPPEIRRQTESANIYRRLIEVSSEHYPYTTPTFAIINGMAQALEEVADIPNVFSNKVVPRGPWHEGTEGHFAGRIDGWRELFSSIDGRQLVRS
jgi:hypothetical protein